MNIKELNICECFYYAFNGLQKSKMIIEKMSEDTRSAIKRIADFYRICENEAIILVLAIETYYVTYEKVGFKEIKELIRCDIMKIIPFKNQILSLIEKHFFFREFELNDNMAFRINDQILDSLYLGSFDGITDVGEDLNDRYFFVKKFHEMYKSCDSVTNTYKISKLNDMEDSFAKLDFVNKLQLLIPKKEDRFIFYNCCGSFLDGMGSDILSTLHEIYCNNMAKRKAKAMVDGNDYLIQNEFLELDEAESISDTFLELTDKGKEILLGEDFGLYEKKFSAKDLIEPEKINDVKLFYSSKNRKQVETLTEYLSPTHFYSIQENLEKRGMRIGFTVLLHGAPGTGKTETVYQIAKKTSRRIVKVDVSKVKSCWFGESEKLIKDIFSRYKGVCYKAAERGENTPILLFNEADAIFSRRKDVSTGNVAQTENAIQNIILDEMENLEGILIATTNLTDNFDSAFERRFLYKIHFDNPTDETRLSIWGSRISNLPEASIERLSRHELSGGQIDNIVRKATMNEILTGEPPCLENLEELCSEEKLSNNTTVSRIGF